MKTLLVIGLLILNAWSMPGRFKILVTRGDTVYYKGLSGADTVFGTIDSAQAYIDSAGLPVGSGNIIVQPLNSN